MRPTTSITMEESVLNYARAKAKELGVTVSTFLEACVSLEIINPLNLKTMPKATKLSATVALIGVEKARIALAEDNDLRFVAMPADTPVYTPNPDEQRKEISTPIKTIIEDTVENAMDDIVKKSIPDVSELDSIAVHGIFSSDQSNKEPNVDSNNHPNGYSNNTTENNVSDNTDTEKESDISEVNANNTFSDVKHDASKDAKPNKKRIMKMI